MRCAVSEATKEHIDISVATRRIDLLALFIRHGEQLSPEVRGYLADAIKLLLAGELKFPKKRPNFADWFLLASKFGHWRTPRGKSGTPLSSASVSLSRQP